MSIWDTDFGGEESSSIDDILANEEVLLSDVLRCDELLQELKGLNSNLLGYVRSPEIVVGLINTVKAPNADGDDFERYKFPYLAAEVLNCLPEDILSGVAEDESVLKTIFSIIHEESLEKTTSGYMAKIIEAFVRGAHQSMHKYLKEHSKEVIDSFCKHLAHFGAADTFRLLLDIPIIDELCWWNDPKDIVDPVVEALKNKTSCRFAAVVLLSIIQRATVFVRAEPPRAVKTLLEYLLCPATFTRIMDNMFESNDSEVVYHTSAVLNRCFWISLPSEKFGLGGEDSVLHTAGVDDREKAEMGTLKDCATMKEIALIVMKNYDRIVKLLRTNMTDETVFLTCDSKKMKKCSQATMMICEFLYNFFQFTGVDQLLSAIESGLMNCLFELLVEYPYNTYLHRHVLFIVRIAVNRKHDALLNDMFKKTNLLQVLADHIADKSPLTGQIQSLLVFFRDIEDTPALMPLLQSFSEWERISQNVVMDDLFKVLFKVNMSSIPTRVLTIAEMAGEDFDESSSFEKPSMQMPTMDGKDGFDDEFGEFTSASSTSASSASQSSASEDDFDFEDEGEKKPKKAAKKETKKKSTKKTAKKSDTKAKAQDDDFDDFDADFDDAPVEKVKEKPKVKKATKAKVVEDDDFDADFD